MSWIPGDRLSQIFGLRNILRAGFIDTKGEYPSIQTLRYTVYYTVHGLGLIMFTNIDSTVLDHGNNI